MTTTSHNNEPLQWSRRSYYRVFVFQTLQNFIGCGYCWVAKTLVALRVVPGDVKRGLVLLLIFHIGPSTTSRFGGIGTGFFGVRGSQMAETTGDLYQDGR